MAGEEANKFLLDRNSIFRGVFIREKNSVLCLFPEGGVTEVVIYSDHGSSISAVYFRLMGEATENVPCIRMAPECTSP